jgi:hypothetical protein
MNDTGRPEGMLRPPTSQPQLLATRIRIDSPLFGQGAFSPPQGGRFKPALAMPSHIESGLVQQSQ